ncbi:MAG: cytochrome c [Deltaproteobacteria bacterium]|nr:cytochrome c [Deltaproteobacteria bacterium]
MLVLLGWLCLVTTACAQDPEHGALLAAVSGCASCHTAEGGAPYAGGFPIETRFGTFYGSNLTPDPEHGLGDWSEEDFVRALRKGRSPAGRPYYPAFPYTSYTLLTDADLADLWTYVQTVAPAPRPAPAHQLKGMYRWRFLLRFWKVTGFRRGPFRPDPDRSDAWNRGGYLVDAAAHCGECHTGRGGLGGLRKRRYLAGNDDPPEPAPNVTPHEHGAGHWSTTDWTAFLEDGMAPDGDFVGGEMRRVVTEGTTLLSDEDRHAMAEYLRAVKPRPSRPPPEPTAPTPDDEPWW